MITFPNAKINIGLHITRKRPDHFHDIETIFYPIGLSDLLEVQPATHYTLHCSGLAVGGDTEDNLVTKAYRLLAEQHDLPPVTIYLHKLIPFGAGLGGGSSDAAFLLKLLNETYQLHLSHEQLETDAARLGADCSFFVRNSAVFAQGKGNEFSPVSLSLKHYYLVLVKPDIFVSTAEAYAGVTPKRPLVDLKEVTQLPISQWPDKVVNDFEPSVFKAHPRIARIKEELYRQGALYASMSGSGSSVYGIFDKEVQLQHHFPDCFYWADFFHD